MPEPVPVPLPPGAAPGRTRAVVVPLVLIALAAVLLAGRWSFRSPVVPATPTPAWAIDTTPIRHAQLAPRIELAGFSYRCSDCHRLFPSPPETDRSLTQHRNIELRHGINSRCFNCHNITNRDAFADEWGHDIPYDQPQLVCAKCHGPVYRDWQHGSHGRTNGYWDPEKGPRQRRRCIECHDPHRPSFPELRPAPPPVTLRMGTQGPPHEGEGVPNPLQVYRRIEELQDRAAPPAAPGAGAATGPDDGR